ncbi:MAG TPA: S41 family peptidase [Chitinophagaceae bacterium]|nr:S41 family peptidase [Chitinophagaceae bacterium]
MKKYFLIAAFSFCSAFLNAQTQASNISPDPARWQEDVKYFGEQLVKKHKNAFHHVSKEEFEKDIERLSNDIPSLKDYQVIVRLMQITAKVGDGHTAVHLPATFKRYPVGFNWFGNDLYVIAATGAYKEALGARLSKIGELTLEEINKKLASVLSQDENKWFDMGTGPAFLIIPEILVTLGIVTDYDHAIFTFLDSTNKEIKLDLTPIPIDPNNVWISASKTQPLFRQKLKDPFWFTYLEDINAVFLSFKNYDDLNKNANKLFDFIEEKKATRLVVDLRFNGGGDFLKGRRLLISRIKENPLINQKGNLFVITGRRTFSAAMVNSIDFKKETNAIILGEPPGERPNSYSENDEMKLPNSGLVVSYSTRYYKFLDEDVPAFEPDIKIDPNWKDFKEGRDPVLEWIISYCKK